MGTTAPPRKTFFVISVFALMAVLVGLLAPVASAAVAAVSPTVDANNKYPLWYQDATGLRVAPCLEGADPQCVLPPAGAEPNFNPALPTHFSDNFPTEFFYHLADSDHLATPGCRSSKPGAALLRMAVEGAFAPPTVVPTAGQQVVFGRVRVRVTSGLCPNAPYTFTYPYGQITITANSAGAIPTTLGTTDIGCLAAPCDFSKALASPIFKSFLTWDPAVAPAAPAGYVGDFAILHPVTGATFTRPGDAAPANYFRIDGERVTGLQTNQWNLSGRIAGPLVASPTALDLGGQNVGTTGAARSVTFTNVGAAPLTIGALTLAGADAGSFAVASQDCIGNPLPQDSACTVGITFSPADPPGGRTASLQVGHDRLGSPFTVNLTGTATGAGSGAIATPDKASLAFGPQRIGVVSPTQRVTITNTGGAPLEVGSVQLTGREAADFIVFNDACTNLVIAASATCVIDVAFLPHGLGARVASLDIASNAALVSVALTGTGTGGIAAVSPLAQPTSGYPEWYQDENGVRVSPCTDGTDPRCVLPPAEPLWNPSVPPDMTTDPINFPSEFFYQLSDSDKLTTPGCGAIAPGKAFIRMGLEGAFLGLTGPVPGNQITFGRIRVFASGLCPNTEYQFINPYGVERFTTNAAGDIPRNAGTEDIGCLAVVPPATCNFADALKSRVLAGFLRWDPAVTPAAPAGYLGDAITLHRVIGGSYIPPGQTAAVDYFKIVRSDAPGTPVAETNLWTISGKLAGPIIADTGAVDFGSVPVNTTSPTTTVTVTNAGASAVTVTSATITGDFAIVAGSDLCSGTNLAAAATCTIGVSFTPTLTGDRTGQLTVDHSGLNTPLVIALHGIGLSGTGTPAFSLTPTQLTFGSQLTTTQSTPQSITISNVGGTANLDIVSVTLGGANPTDFTFTSNPCNGVSVPPGSTCIVQVAFAPATAGALAATVVVQDNAPGAPHTAPLSGVAFAGTKSVSAANDANNGFPNWYQDSNGARVEPCIEGADPKCVLAGSGLNPGQPTVFPTNFPSEFFYWLADANPGTPVSDASCGASGTADLRLALEGSFLGGSPVAGQQSTFGRIRITAAGLCPNTAYTFVHPFGSDTFTTNGAGAIPANAGTQDIGCAAAPCNFAAALPSRVFNGFLRWDPAFGAAPVGYLGDAVTPHRVTGATFTAPGDTSPANLFRVLNGTTVLGQTNMFLVSGRTAAPLKPAPASLSFAGQNVGSSSAPQSVTFTNQGNAGVTVTPAINGDYAIGAGNTCSGTLASDATCTVPVTFTPTIDGVRTGQLSLTSSSGASSTVPLTGIGLLTGQAVPVITPSALDFGDQAVNVASAPKLVTVTNAGAVDLVVSGSTVTSPSDFQRVSTTCAAPVPPLGQCTIGVTFSPSASGARSATLTITSNSATGSDTVPLTGVGVQPASTLAPTSLAFNSLRIGTQSAAQAVTVTNSGNGTLNVTGVSLQGANGGDFAFTNGCLAPLAPGPGCTISVTFTPTATGARNASLQILTDTPQSPQTVALAGTGIASAVTLSKTPLSFGNIPVGRTTTKTLSVQNTGTATLTFFSFTFSGGNAPLDYSITQNTCTPLPIGVRGKCSITIQFAPKATGSRTANLVLADDAPNTPQTVPLTGNGR